MRAPNKRAVLSPARTSSEQLEAALRAALFGAPKPAERLAQMGYEHIASGGKRLRARLALVCAELWQAPQVASLAWAVACELLHNGTLVHDDLQDGDTVRRGAPTTWVRFGAAQAINVGDWLLMRAFAAVDDASSVPPALGWPLSQALRTALETVIVGQTEECHWRGGRVVAWPAYLACVRAKTAALFALPVAGAALLAGQSPTERSAAADPFAAAGELFQLADDIIDLYGDKGRAEPGQDLYEGKMSALVVAHADLQPADASWLEGLLRAPREHTDAHEVARARRAFVASGALAAVKRRTEKLADQAMRGCPAALQPVMSELLTAICTPLDHLLLPPAEAASA